MYTPSALFEPDRLASLYRRNLLNSPKDPALDRVTQFIAHVLGVPIGLLSLVDHDHQFFLSYFGLSGAIAETRETPITHSFCQYVVTFAEPFVVDDARVDPLVRNNLATKEHKVVAYVGVPLITRDGNILGALSAIDNKPRHWTLENVELLSALAAHVIAELELRAKTAELGAEIKTAQRNDAERVTATRLTVHDLRSPLTGLLLSLEMLPQMGPLNADQSDLISVCVRTGGTLRKLIDSLLEVHALEGGGVLALQPTLLSPSHLIELAVDQVRALAADRSIELTVLPPGEVSHLEVDEEKFVRVLVNLLANGIKFTPRGGRVGISISQTGAREAAAVIFAVKDTGIGIRTSHARRIFKEGIKLNAAAMARESTGLGLTYCKRVIEAHGGSIWVESVPGKGSTFFVRIPCEAPSTASSCLSDIQPEGPSPSPL